MARLGKWAIHYDDGSVFTSNDGGPRDAPRTGVVVIADENDQVGWVAIHSEDYYYWEPEIGWNATDILGMRDHLERCRNPLVLFGRQVPLKQYRETLAAVRKNLGEKNAYMNEERKR